jgi:hypothetical protein
VRREPEKTVLYQLVCAHLETMLAEVRDEDEEGNGLPWFVERELRRYLDCGILARGFMRLVCEACGKELVVGFSCKGRGFCPSCVARRMDDTAAYLVDCALPVAPYRHWVLSLPFRLRLRLARSEELLGRVRRVFVAQVGAWQRREARKLGLGDVETGAVCVTQRFGSRLDCNPHFHALMPDAVFAENAEGRVELRRLAGPKQEDIEWLVERIARRALAALEDGEEGEAPGALDRLRAQSQQLGLPAMPPRDGGRLEARCEGFSLQAATHLHANDRKGLERTCRYALRPPVALNRLSETESGNVVLQLKRRMSNGARSIELAPEVLLRRLAALVPRPRVHQIAYFGAFASHAAIRGRVVPRRPRRTSWCTEPPDEPEGQLELPLPEPVVARLDLMTSGAEVIKAPCPRERTLRWADLLRRTFDTDVLHCECGGRRRVVAFVEDLEEAAQLLARLGVPSEVPVVARARAPPQRELFERLPGFTADTIYPDN